MSEQEQAKKVARESFIQRERGKLHTVENNSYTEAHLSSYNTKLTRDWTPGSVIQSASPCHEVATERHSGWIINAIPELNNGKRARPEEGKKRTRMVNIFVSLVHNGKQKQTNEKPERR